MPTKDPDVGIAFALVTGAGMATALGAAIVFSPTLVKYASRRTLAGALGLSAGVMTYVSFAEIFAKSRLSFIDAGHSEDDAYIYATLCFFGGVLLMITLNSLVTFFLGGHGHHNHNYPSGNGKNDTQPVSNVSNAESVEARGATSTHAHAHSHSSHTHTHKTHSVEEVTRPPACPCCADDPVGDLEELHKMAAQIVEYETRENHEWEGQAQSDKSERSDEGEGGEEVENNNDETQEDDRVSEDKEAEEQKALMRMSINTAVAIGLHNFPEGLATFVAALNDTRVGAVLAVAIAIHNIPEGLCVAMPVYYATGNRWKAFGWAVLSGVSEPIAALLGWAVLANSFSDDMYAILFGLVAGMMVIISVRELLPTAHRYDPEDTVVTYSFMVGMAIMAVSLVLFLI